MPIHLPNPRPKSNPFGSSIKSRSYSAGSGFRFGFNGKENFDQYQDYGFRIYYPNLGKFLSADPLIVHEKKYPELSSFQFASNTPISAIDLDGLEAKLAIAFVGGLNTHYTPEDKISFRTRASKFKKIGFSLINGVNNGNSLINEFEKATNEFGSISTIITFAHSNQTGIFMDNDDGFYKEGESASPLSTNFSNVNNLLTAANEGKIKFTVNACWLFASCNTANSLFTSDPLAKSVASKLKINTIGATGPVFPEVINGKETGNLITSGVFIKFIPVMEITEKVKIQYSKICGITIPFTGKKIFERTVKWKTLEFPLGNKIDPQKVIK